MQHVLERLLAFHRHLRQHAFYGLALSSGLACLMLYLRMQLSERATFGFMLWNLFLAWVPYLLSLATDAELHRNPRAWWRLLLPSAFWLLFLPNATYLVTDLIHLRPREYIPLWFDVGMLALFALCGCFLAVVSIQIMQEIVASYVGRIASWVFVAITLGLNGLGVYLGRFQRWNSWNVFTHPDELLMNILRIISRPQEHVQAVGVTGMFTLLLLACYVAFTHPRSRTMVG